ncbi:MAG: PepSY-associated TM helix domain-containing protein, partial [Planctomycetaceae bacterium]
GKFLSFPKADQPFYMAFVTEDSDYFWIDVFVDPGSGKVVGTVDNFSLSIEGCLQIAIGLHIRLCAGEFGRKLVDASVVLFLVELLTGLLLWWRGFAHFRRAFVVRVHRSRFLAYHDSHRLMGLLAFPFLLVMILTALLWGYPQVMVPLVYWSCGETPPAALPDESEIEAPNIELLPPESQRLPLREMTWKVQAGFPGAAIEYIRVDDSRARNVLFGLNYPATDTEPQHNETVTGDRLSGEVRSTQIGPVRKRTFADRLTNEWAHELHYGSIGGLTTKILYLAACLAVDLLYATGISMWLIKRRKRRRSLRTAAIRN